MSLYFGKISDRLIVAIPCQFLHHRVTIYSYIASYVCIASYLPSENILCPKDSVFDWITSSCFAASVDTKCVDDKNRYYKVTITPYVITMHVCICMYVCRCVCM